jgi:PPOX class probable F420-dependent enzyme
MPTPTEIPASHRDLVESPGVVVLSTVGADGYPQSTANWYLLDGDVIVTSLTRSRQKFRNLVAHPKATLFFFDPTNQYRTLEIRADAAIEDDPDLTLLKRVLAHYGQDLESFGGPLEDRVVVTFTPHRAVTFG